MNYYNFWEYAMAATCCNTPPFNTVYDDDFIQDLKEHLSNPDLEIVADVDYVEVKDDQS